MTTTTVKVFSCLLVAAIILLALVSRWESPPWIKPSSSENTETDFDDVRKLFQEFYQNRTGLPEDIFPVNSVSKSDKLNPVLETKASSSPETPTSKSDKFNPMVQMQTSSRADTPTSKSDKFDPMIQALTTSRPEVNVYTTTNESYQEPGVFHKIGEFTGPHWFAYTNDLWVYSVFYQRADPRTGVKAGVRAVGLVPVRMRRMDNKTLLVFCHLTYGDESEKVTVAGKVRYFGPIHLTNKIQYLASIAECHLPEDKAPPRGVSFSLAANGTKSHSFSVINPVVEKRRKFVVCYSVVYGDYDDYMKLLQNVEYNIMMGAEHFYIYVQSVGPRVAALLDFYKKKGIFSVLSMPRDPGRKAWYYSQTTALNDCHCRARYTSDYIAIFDFDEYIFPLQHNNWGDLLKTLESGEGWMKSKETDEKSELDPSLKAAHFSFRHTYYCRRLQLNSTEWATLKRNLSLTDSEESFIRDRYIYLFLEMYRTGFWDYPARVKTIYRPEYVLEAGTHVPQKIAPGTRAVAVDSDVAFMQHHNHRARIDDKTCRLDLRIQPFHRQFLQRLQDAYSQFKDILSKTDFH